MDERNQLLSEKSSIDEITMAHWKYIRELLRVHEISESTIRIIEFYYTTAFEHGWKHGIEQKN